MIKKLLIMVLVLMHSAFSYSQSNLWTKASEDRLASLPKVKMENIPSEYELYNLDLQGLKNILRNAPQRGNNVDSQVVVYFPDAEGKFEKFKVFETQAMHPELAAKYPGIKTYMGKGVDNPSLSMRFSVTLFGLHTMTFSNDGVYYAQPFTQDKLSYIVYNKTSLTGPRTFGCEFGEDLHETAGKEILSANSTQANDGVLRTFRLAMACTFEYATFHINQAGVSGGTNAQKIEAVLAAMNITVDRVNSVYERDLAVTMQIVPENENVIFLTSNDGLTNNNAGALLGEIQSIVDANVGSANYDIGHVVSTSPGGIAQLGCVCSSNKARGVTGSFAPVGDPFDIDYVAHEMGHQFGANHTFNASTGSCAGNRTQSTAVEPGSGSTIMGYAGICSFADVQGNSDAYFHAASISQIVNFLSADAFCATTVDLDNTAPDVTFVENKSIPMGTAFVLRGEATDAEGDDLTYTWEQTDNNGPAANQPTSAATSGPVFRSLAPSESPDRYFPNFQTVLLGSLSNQWEVIPTVGRTLNFALTVRDNNPEGGQTGRANMVVNVVGGAGPFAVTSQSSFGTVYGQGSTQTVTWDVANTDIPPVSTSNVNILLSTDGGNTFEVLVADTPNDGEQAVIIPEDAELSSDCRIIVEAVDNIFYAINLWPFEIDDTNAADSFGLTGFKLYPNPNTGIFTVEFTPETADDINVMVHDMRGRQIFGQSYANTGIFSGNINLEGIQSGVYLVSVQNGNQKEVKRIVVE